MPIRFIGAFYQAEAEAPLSLRHSRTGRSAADEPAAAGSGKLELVVSEVP
jgi:hypothetical protein